MSCSQIQKQLALSWFNKAQSAILFLHYQLKSRSKFYNYVRIHVQVKKYGSIASTVTAYSHLGIYNTWLISSLSLHLIC